MNNIQEYARDLRKNGTIGEKHLWKKILSRRQLYGYKFHRQKVLGKYIFDFYCYDLQLVIEIDGSSHNSTSLNDDLKTKFAKDCDLTLIRFTEYDARFKIEDVYVQLDYIVHTLEKQIQA